MRSNTAKMRISLAITWEALWIKLLTNALLESASELWKEGWRQLSYERIPYEKKAMAFGKKIKRHIRDKGNPCVPNAIRR